MALAIVAASAASASAQYYQMVNQATDMISAALQGGLNYRGFVEASYISGIGNKKASFLELSTTQGFKYGSIFFMGVGAGVDLMMSEVNDGAYYPDHTTTKTSAMIPLFTDFRLNFGDPANTNMFIDLKVGAGFWVGNKYILVGDGYINSSSSFYLKPTVGLRVPVSTTNDKLAINIGASYQLLTNDYWYNPGHDRSVTLNGLGVSFGFEW